MSQNFATCDFCDVYKNDSSGEFRVLPPVFRDFGAIKKFSGMVETVKCFEDNTLVKAAVDSPGNGKILVVDGGGSLALDGVKRGSGGEAFGRHDHRGAVDDRAHVA